MIRIVLAEDHALVREGTRRMLEQYPDLEVVGEAEDGEAALGLITQLRPDVAILDLRMPRLNGIEVARRLAGASSPAKVLVLTAYDDDDFVFAAIDAGIPGYLLKTVRSSELADAVRAVARGEVVLHPEISRQIALRWARSHSREGRAVEQALTPREMEVLGLAARGMRNREIGTALGISARTVEGHFSSVLAKLGVASRTAAVIYGAAHHWFRLDDPEGGEGR